MTSLLVLCAWLLGAAPQTPIPGEVVADIRVHGNHVTPDAEVIRLSGLTKGAPVTADTVTHAEKLLKSSGRFDDAQVLKLFASIEEFDARSHRVMIGARSLETSHGDHPS